MADLSSFRENGKKRRKEKNVIISSVKEEELINHYNFYVEKNKELKLKAIEIKEKNKYFHKKNYYMYIKVEKLDNVIKALNDLNKQQQSGVDFDINGIWF